jgi:hypothetical protein
MLEELIAKQNDLLDANNQIMAKLVTALATAPTPSEPVPKAEEPKADAPKTNQRAPSTAPATIEDVRAALVDVAKSKGRDAALGVLTGLNARTVGDLSEGDYGKAVAAAQAA